MRSGFASLAIVGVAACAAIYALHETPASTNFNQFTSEDFQFLKYISKFGKSYGTKEEFEFRFKLFHQALMFISSENSRNENTFTLGLNKFADWTPEERMRLLSYKSQSAQATKVADFSNVSIPSEIDWRTEGAVNAVQDQGQCGSCWAFSAIGAIEGRNKIANGELLKFSEQQLVDCAGGPVYQNEGCNGGYMNTAIDYVAAQGNMLEADYPYTAVDGSCKYDADKTYKNKPTGNTAVKPGSSAALQAAIADGPVSVAIEADTLFFQFYSGGVFNSKYCGTNLDHGVVAVGYGLDNGKPFYIVRNSWGASWGEKGYIRIAIVDGNGICGIQMDSVFPNY